MSNETLSPAFNTPRAAIAFAVLLLFFLTLPLLLQVMGIPKPENIYCEVPNNTGPFAYFKEEIFDKEGDIDILFLGPSLIWNAVDALMVQEALSKKLGRPANVINFGSNWRGEDLYYTLLRDLSARRKIHLLIFNPPMSGQYYNEPHERAHYWSVFGRDYDAFAGLSFGRKLQAYGLSVLGAPRHLLGLLREEKCMEFHNARESKGTSSLPLGYRGAPFVAQNISPPRFTVNELLYSTENKSRFLFQGPKIGDYQGYYVKMTFLLAHARDIPVASIALPTYAGREMAEVREWKNWREFTGVPLAMLGVPNQRLFATLSEEQIQRLYYDDNHLNANGSQYFTRAMLPGILELYDRARKTGTTD